MKPELAAALKAARLRSGLRQEDVAKEIGVKRSTIGNYENGSSTPDMERYIQMCRLYHENYITLAESVYGASKSRDSTENEERGALIEAIVNLLSQVETKTLRELEWVISGRHQVDLVSLMQMILIYLHLDLSHRTHCVEWMYGTLSFLREQDRCINKGDMEPDIDLLNKAMQRVLNAQSELLSPGGKLLY